MRFRDRTDAGRQLGLELMALRAEQPLVLGLARGGIPVAAEVAAALDAPLDVLVVRKIGHPDQREVAVGAIAEGGASVVDPVALWGLGLDVADLDLVVAEERVELERRVDVFRHGRPLPPLEGRTVVLVDDGMASGLTARAAVDAVTAAGAGRVVLAVPVASRHAADDLRPVVSDVVALTVPAAFRAVGDWYADFAPVADAEVLRLLAHGPRPAPPPRRPHCGTEADVEVPADGGRLRGWLEVPPGAEGLVVFAHGRGSGRDSPRNLFVAHRLNDAGLATLLVDLAGPDEAVAGRDVDAMAARLLAVCAWSVDHGLPSRLALFGASTGAAAALVAAARLGTDVAAVVSRGGRPDLAAAALPQVVAPTLLLVGGADQHILALNRSAARRLTGCEHELLVIPGASHLFLERGSLEAVAHLSAWWITTHLGATAGVAVAEG